MRRKIVIPAAAIITGCVIIAAAGVLKQTDTTRKDVVAYVDEEPVYLKELEHFVDKSMQKERALLIEQSGIEPSAFMWKDKVKGKSGYEWLSRSALEEASSVKIIQREARELGLVDEIRYPKLMEQCKQENEERESQKKEGQVLYGVVTYSQDQYYDYFNSNLELRYKEKLIEDKILTVSEKAILKTYEDHLEYFNHKPFEEVKDSARSVEIDNQYTQYKDSLVKKAKVRMTDGDRVIERLKEILGETDSSQ